MSILAYLALATASLAPPFAFNFTTAACYDGNSQVSSCNGICAVGKTGYTSPVNTSSVDVYYSGFVIARMSIVSPESAVGSFAGGITYVATRPAGSQDFLFVVVLDKAATCTLHGNVTSTLA